MKKKILVTMFAIVLVMALIPMMAVGAADACEHVDEGKDDVCDTCGVAFYGLWVGGVWVTDNTLSGEGWVYDPDTSTLTLTNATIKDYIHINPAMSTAQAGIEAINDLNIVLVGENTITDMDVNSDVWGISCDGNLTISGSGSLTIDSAPYTNTEAHQPIESYKSLNISGVTINVKMGFGVAIAARDSVNVENASITAEVRGMGIASGNVTIKDSAVKIASSGIIEASAIQGTGGITIDNSVVTAEAYTYTIHSESHVTITDSIVDIKNTHETHGIGIFAGEYSISGNSHVKIDSAKLPAAPYGSGNPTYMTPGVDGSFFARGEKDGEFENSLPQDGQYLEIITEAHLGGYISHSEGKHSLACNSCEISANVIDNELCSYSQYGICSKCHSNQPAVKNNNIYEISNQGQFLWFADKVNSGETAINGKLISSTSTISFSKDIPHTPIGTTDNPYVGTFDGQLNRIQGMVINSTEDYQGLFGVVGAGAVIKNIIIFKGEITGGDFTAALVGGSVHGTKGTVTIESCIVNSCTVNGGKHTGGIFGGNTGADATIIIRNCANIGSTITGTSLSGAIAGYLGNSDAVGTIENCWNSGKLICNDRGDSFAHFDAANIINCYNFATLTASTKEGVATFTISDLTSGVLAYKLGGNWGQTIGANFEPVLGGAKVYYGYTDCQDTTAEYSNTELKATQPEHTYENGVCTFCGTLKAVLKGRNLTLGGIISMNFYFEIDKYIVNSGEAYVLFTLEDGRSIKISVTADKLDATTGYYKFSCPVYATEMADTIKAEVVMGDNTSKAYERTIVSYATGIIGGEYTDTEKALIKAMLNYGAYAQIEFSYNTDRLANASLDEAEKVLSAEITKDTFATTITSENLDGIGKFAGASLLLGSETTLKAYFKPVEGVTVSDLAFSVGDKTLTPTMETIGETEYIVVKITNISADKLGDIFTVTVTNGTTSGTFQCSAFRYCYNVLNAADDEALVNTLKAMYVYNQATEAYLATAN